MTNTRQNFTLGDNAAQVCRLAARTKDYQGNVQLTGRTAAGEPLPVSLPAWLLTAYAFTLAWREKSAHEGQWLPSHEPVLRLFDHWLLENWNSEQLGFFAERAKEAEQQGRPGGYSQQPVEVRSKDADGLEQLVTITLEALIPSARLRRLASAQAALERNPAALLATAGH